MKDRSLTAPVSSGRTIRDFSRFISRFKARFYARYRMQLIMRERGGIHFEDQHGRKLINCHCNGGVFNLGHQAPQIRAALEEGLQVGLDIGNHHLISDGRARLARELVESTYYGFDWPGQRLAKCVFGVSGGEAVDLALKLARGATGRDRIVSLQGGYHGHTGLALASGDASYRDPFRVRLAHFEQIQFKDLASIQDLLDENTAALILETIPATLGMPIIPVETMQHIRRVCDRLGVALILDEIQTGLGRTGKVWAYHHYKIQPDILITGKGLSGGIYPMSATLFRKKYEKVFKLDPFIHISTFGGSELGCPVALAVVRESTSREFLDNVRMQAELFERELTDLCQPDGGPLVEVRQKGLFMGLVFVDRATCLAMVKALLANGVFAIYANNDKRVLQFLPPLIISESETKQLLELVKKSLNDLDRFRYKLLKKFINFMED